MNSIINKLEDGTIELTITIPVSLIKKTREQIIEEHAKVAEIPGFRKGMAPKHIVEKSLNENHIREDILRRLLPQTYSEAVKKHNLNPIINPKIHVKKLEENKDWEFTALTAELPQINLGDYKDAIRKITSKSKIIIPGKQSTPVSFEEISNALIENIKFTVPKIIIDVEVDRLLSQTLDEIKRLGLTLDQYLSSTGKTIDSLRSEYTQKAEKDIKLEFILQKIAQEEKIKVEEKEIEEAINQAKDEKERKNLEENKYLLASIIRQQKTLDFIKSL
jgi:FKBP-type peptidyl-prolyl cis-trans isomerase (trigger factor)